MIFAIVGALVVGLSLGIFGSGGSILTVPVLVYLLHHGDKIAIAESLGIVGSIACIGAIPYARDRLIEWRMAFLFGIPGMAGTFAGAWASGFVPGYVQLLVFGVVMLLAAIRMWMRSRRDTSGSAPTPRGRVPIAATCLLGTGVGVMTGFVGVGGGFLIVPALVLLCGLPMRRATATSLVIITMNAAVGLLKHHQAITSSGEQPHWDVIGVFVVFGAVGSLAGKSLQSRINQRALQRGFSVFLVAMALFILVRESLTLVSA